MASLAEYWPWMSRGRAVGQQRDLFVQILQRLALSQIGGVSLMTTGTQLRCSFCRRDCADSELIVGDLGARICLDCLRGHHDSSISECTTAARRSAQLDASEMLRALPLISAEVVQLDRFLRQQVAAIREQRVSYQRIGDALGVTKQAAWERFSPSILD